MPSIYLAVRHSWGMKFNGELELSEQSDRVLYFINMSTVIQFNTVLCESIPFVTTQR